MVGHRIAHLGEMQALVLAAVVVATGTSVGWSLLGLPGEFVGVVFLASLAAAAVLAWPAVEALYPETADDRT